MYSSHHLHVFLLVQIWYYEYGIIMAYLQCYLDILQRGVDKVS